MCGLVFFDFTFLVQVDTFLSCITLLFEFAAFMILKYKEPDAPRPYVVPGGMFGAWLITVPKVIVVLFTLVFANWLVIVSAVGINVLVITAYGIKVWVDKRQGNSLDASVASRAAARHPDSSKTTPDVKYSKLTDPSSPDPSVDGDISKPLPDHVSSSMNNSVNYTSANGHVI